MPIQTDRRTDGGSGDGVRLVLVRFERTKDIDCGVQGAGPDHSQPREVQRQQRKPRPQGVATDVIRQL
jgi:hypothetical protein